MTTAALLPDQAAEARGHVDAAIAELKLAAGAVENCGPALVFAYRALGMALELREAIGRLPVIGPER